MSDIIKKSLRTTIFTSVLATASFSAPHSSTIYSDLVNLHPLSPWAVSQVGANTDSPYCTLSKRFSRNIMMTLAESEGQNLTFAIDFQKDRFLPTSTYNIILATDNGDSRVYEVNPATEKAFIIRIRDDEEFYENLWGSSSLSVSVNTENYKFQTADLKSGKGQISSCLSDIQDIKVQKERPSKKELKAEIVENEVHATSVIRTEQAATIITEPVELPQNQESPAENKKTTAKNIHEISRFANEIEVLKQENRDLRAALKTERSEYEAELAAFRNSHASEAAQKISSLEAENASLRLAMETLKSEAGTKNASFAQSLNDEIKRLSEENEVLKASLNASETAHRATKSRHDSVEISQKEFETLKQQGALLNSQMTKLQAENVALTAALNDQETDNKNKDILAENISLRQQVSKKEAKLSEVQIALTSAQAKIKDYETVKQQLVSVQSENEELAASFAALETAAGDVTPAGADEAMNAWQKRYEEQQLEMERMAREMQQQEQSFKQEKEKLESMLFDPAVTEKAQIEHLAALEAELSRLRGEQPPAMAAENSRSILPAVPPAGAGNLSLMEMSEEIQRLRGEIDRLRRVPVQSRVEKVEMTERTVIMSSKPKKDMAQVVMEPTQEIVPSPEPDFKEQIAINDNDIMPPLFVDEPDPVPEGEAQLAEISPAAAPASMIPAPPMIEESPVAEASASEKDMLQDQQPQKSLFVSSQGMGGLFQALPDQMMLEAMKKNDKSLLVKKSEFGTVFWASEEIEGTLVRKLLNGSDFEESVNNVISNLYKNCPAVIDIEPVLLRKGKEENLFVYDADCGAQTVGLLFYSKDGQTLSTISYGAAKDQKETLDQKREKLIDALIG